jgi:hypothetical protein
MAIDRDVPISPLQRRILVIGLIVMATFGIALFGGLIPGLRPNYAASDVGEMGGHSYYVGSTPLRVPMSGNSTPPWNVSFHNVTFVLWLTNWNSFRGGEVHGNGTEQNGTRYTFVLGEILPNGSRTQFFLSTDRVFGAYWAGGWLGGSEIELWVEQSYTMDIGRA